MRVCLRLVIAATISLVVFFGFLVPESFAAKYYVDKKSKGGSCSDSNPGTEVAPWCTIGKAAQTLVAGDTVYIRAGTYTEEVTPINSGISGNYITYQNYSGETVWIDGENTKYNGFDLNDDHYIRIVGLKFKNQYFEPSSCCGGGIDISNSSYVEVTGCEIKDTSWKGIKLWFSDHVTISGNTIHDVGEGEERAHCVYVGASQYVTIENNNLYNSSRHAIQLVGDIASETYTEYIHIRNNDMHHNGNTAINSEPKYSRYVIVEKNKIRDNNRVPYCAEAGLRNAGMYFLVQNNAFYDNMNGLALSGQWNIVRRNLVYENNHSIDSLCNRLTYNMNKMPSGAHFRDCNGSGCEELGVLCEDNVLIHNTFYRNSVSTSYFGSIAIGYSTSADRSRVKNNIVSETQGPFEVKVNLDENHVIDHNNYYNSSRSLAFGWLLNWNQTSPTRTFDQWKTDSGQDAHSITTDPRFQNPGGANFRLQANSSSIDAGGFLTTTTSSGSGQTVSVVDASFFCDGYSLIRGDLIQVGSNDRVRITNVNYDANIITVDKSISWKKDDGVSYPYSGNSPDIGAYEYQDTGHFPSPTSLQFE